MKSLIFVIKTNFIVKIKDREIDKAIKFKKFFRRKDQKEKLTKFWKANEKKTSRAYQNILKQKIKKEK